MPSAEKIRALASPLTHPDRPQTVELVETHFAWVFLADRYVWKMRKPVRFFELDYGDLGARRAAAEAEVMLNRPLAPRVYLGVVPLARTPQGLRPGGAGPVAEWLVRMRRLPRERMLERRLESGGVALAELERLVRRLDAFYRAAGRAPWSGGAYVAHLEAEVERVWRDVAAVGLGRWRPAAEAVRRRLDAAYARSRPLIAARADAGRVVEAHGDLRPEHIWLGPWLAIIDRLEFDRSLRWLDTLEELAYLALECERLGSGGTGRSLIELYRRECDAEWTADVLDYYRMRRALVRSRLMLRRLLDSAPGTTDHNLARAGAYLEAALA